MFIHANERNTSFKIKMNSNHINEIRNIERRNLFINK